MPPLRLLLLTTITMLAFAANSILCRVALAEDHIGAASFTFIRIASGAVFLALLLLIRTRSYRLGGSWLSGAALFGYAAAFSFAYISLSAATGALLLFAAVQATMITYGLWSGERLSARQFIGIAVAFAGLVWLMLPGIEAPPLLGAVIMIGSGVCSGIWRLSLWTRLCLVVFGTTPITRDQRGNNSTKRTHNRRPRRRAAFRRSGNTALCPSITCGAGRYIPLYTEQTSRISCLIYTAALRRSANTEITVNKV